MRPLSDLVNYLEVAVNRKTKDESVTDKAAHCGPWSGSQTVPSASVNRRNLLSTTLSGMSKHPGHKYVTTTLLLVLLTLVRCQSFSLGRSACISPRVRHWTGSESTFAILLRRVKVITTTYNSGPH